MPQKCSERAGSEASMPPTASLRMPNVGPGLTNYYFHIIPAVDKNDTRGIISDVYSTYQVPGNVTRYLVMCHVPDLYIRTSALVRDV